MPKAKNSSKPPKPLNTNKTTTGKIPTDEPLTKEETNSIKQRVNLGGRAWDGPPYKQLDTCTICREEIVWYWYDMPALRRGKPPTKVAYDRKYLCYKCISSKWNRQRMGLKTTNWWDNRRKLLNGKGPINGSQ